MKHEDRSHCKVWWFWFLLGHWSERNKTLALQWMEATTHTNRCYHLIINQKWQNQVWLQGLRIWRLRRQERRSSYYKLWLHAVAPCSGDCSLDTCMWWPLSTGPWSQSRSHTGLSTSQPPYTRHQPRSYSFPPLWRAASAPCCGVKRWIMSQCLWFVWLLGGQGQVASRS